MHVTDSAAMVIRADFHIHSCLSPCAALEMAPSVIPLRARERGLDALALTDHNSARNLPAYAWHCKKLGLLALYGLEVETVEECHVLCLFDRLQPAMDLGQRIEPRMTRKHRERPDLWTQPVVNRHDEVEESLCVYLGQSSGFTLDELRGEVQEAGGLFVPAHVSRPAFSLLGQLGFIPEGAYDALEVQHPGLNPSLLPPGVPVITGSDAHHPEDIGRRHIRFKLDGAFTVANIRKAWHTKPVESVFAPAASRAQLRCGDNDADHTNCAK
jgi:3',5'-nucleoside bisphosphate phosphatase